MRKEADGAGARCAFFAQLRAISTGMEPALENTVRKGAAITTFAITFTELGARDCLVRKDTRISTAGLFSCRSREE